jgi:hypothetical protein
MLPGCLAYIMPASAFTCRSANVTPPQITPPRSAAVSHAAQIWERELWRVIFSLGTIEFSLGTIEAPLLSNFDLVPKREQVSEKTWQSRRDSSSGLGTSLAIYALANLRSVEQHARSPT